MPNETATPTWDDIDWSKAKTDAAPTWDEVDWEKAQSAAPSYDVSRDPGTSMTPAQAAAAIGAPGGERLQGELIQGADAAALAKPLFRIPERAKKLAGALLFPTVPKLGEGVARAGAGLIEGLSSPQGVATIPAAVLAPEVVLPEIVKGQLESGAQNVVEGLETKSLSRVAQGALEIALGAAPVAGLLPRSAKAAGEAKAKAAVSKEFAQPPSLSAQPPPLPDLQAGAVKTVSPEVKAAVEGEAPAPNEPPAAEMQPLPPEVSTASLPIKPLPESEQTLGIAPPGARSIAGISLSELHPLEAVSDVWDKLAGKSMPQITEANRRVGELGVRYASSRVAAQHQGALFSAKVLEGLDVNGREFGAWLVEDNLRSIRQQLSEQAHEALVKGEDQLAQELMEEVGQVRTIVGERNSPFRDEAAYQAFFERTEVQAALERHKQYWHDVIEPMYKSAMDIDPETELSSRGLQSGARINLKAILDKDEPVTKPVTARPGNLTASFKRKSPFGRRATGSADSYESWYPDIIANTFNRQLEIANQNKFNQALVENGLAVVDKPGQQVEIEGKPAVPFPLQRRLIITKEEGQTQVFNAGQSIYVKSNLASEYRRALNVDEPHRYESVAGVNNALNKAALAGLTDFTVHNLNLMTALMRAPNGNPVLGVATKLAGRSDVLITLGRALAKATRDNREQLAELAEIGALRESHVTKPSEIGAVNFLRFPQKTLGAAIQWMDKTTRLVLDDIYQELSESGLIKADETSRREFVNQVGQYNKRLQDKFTVWLRDTGLGPFVTAGKTFNTMGIRNVTMNPGVRGATASAEAALRIEQIANWVGAAVLVGTLNYMFTGSLSGREGTKIGNIDFGTEDAQGRPQSFPLFGLLGLDRSLRVMGAKGAMESVRQGLPLNIAVDSAFRDLVNSWTGPMAGPPVRFGFVAASGHAPAVGVAPVAEAAGPNQSQAVENLWAAARDANPLVKSYMDYREGKPMSEVMRTQLPRLVMQPGPAPEKAAAMPKIIEAVSINNLVDDSTRRLRKLPLEERQEEAQKIAERKQLTPAQSKKFHDGLTHKGVFKYR